MSGITSKPSRGVDALKVLRRLGKKVGTSFLLEHAIPIGEDWNYTKILAFMEANPEHLEKIDPILNP